jgi:hypothetical protein
LLRLRNQGGLNDVTRHHIERDLGIEGAPRDLASLPGLPGPGGSLPPSTVGATIPLWQQPTYEGAGCSHTLGHFRPRRRATRVRKYRLGVLTFSGACGEGNIAACSTAARTLSTQCGCSRVAKTIERLQLSLTSFGGTRSPSSPLRRAPSRSSLPSRKRPSRILVPKSM